MKAKGLIVKSFPKHWTEWTDPEKPNTIFTKKEIEFNNKLLIEKRSYFMRYLYPKYNNEYKAHINKYDYLCYREFGIHIDELIRLEHKTEEQQNLVDNYNKFNPLLETDCLMNNICRHMEKEVKEIKINVRKSSPDYIFNTLYNPKIEITEEQINKMEKEYKKYLKSKSANKNINLYGENDSEDIYIKDELTPFDFDYISDDIQKLANIAVYINYVLYPNSSKDFCWNIFGNGILLNIYDNSDKQFYIPLLNSEGNIKYMGKKYKNERVDIECQ